MTTQIQNQLNGVNLDQLIGTVQAIQGTPELARFQFRARNEWVSGGHSRTEIQGFYGASSEDTSRARPFVLEGDEPPVLLGSNQGPNAVEAVLHALASCLAVGFVYNAAVRALRSRAWNSTWRAISTCTGSWGSPTGFAPGTTTLRSNTV
jgi:hypothetical protein